MNIKETFLQLTSKTYPHGTEEQLFPILYNIVDNLQKDEFGNLFIKIGDSDVMFTSHLDTATSANTPVNHVFDGKIIKTDGKSILGADDKAGVTIMLYMIKNQTLVSASSVEKAMDKKKKMELSVEVGKLVAKRALEKGIKEVYFDRGRYKYHGRIKVLADSARKEGLKF